jgi:hypothetical protein
VTGERTCSLIHLGLARLPLHGDGSLRRYNARSGEVARIAEGNPHV